MDQSLPKFDRISPPETGPNFQGILGIAEKPTKCFRTWNSNRGPSKFGFAKHPVILIPKKKPIIPLKKTALAFAMGYKPAMAVHLWKKQNRQKNPIDTPWNTQKQDSCPPGKTPLSRKMSFFKDSLSDKNNLRTCISGNVSTSRSLFNQPTGPPGASGIWTSPLAKAPGLKKVANLQEGKWWYPHWDGGPLNNQPQKHLISRGYLLVISPFKGLLGWLKS